MKLIKFWLIHLLPVDADIIHYVLEIISTINIDDELLNKNFKIVKFLLKYNLYPDQDIINNMALTDQCYLLIDCGLFPDTLKYYIDRYDNSFISSSEDNSFISSDEDNYFISSDEDT